MNGECKKECEEFGGCVGECEKECESLGGCAPKLYEESQLHKNKTRWNMVLEHWEEVKGQLISTVRESEREEMENACLLFNESIQKVGRWLVDVDEGVQSVDEESSGIMESEQVAVEQVKEWGNEQENEEKFFEMRRQLEEKERKGVASYFVKKNSNQQSASLENDLMCGDYNIPQENEQATLTDTTYHRCEQGLRCGMYPLLRNGGHMEAEEYKPFAFADMNCILAKLPSPSEGGAPWMARLMKATMGHKLALGDWRALMREQTSLWEVQQVEMQAGTTQVPDSTSFAIYATEISTAMRQRFPVPLSSV